MSYTLKVTRTENYHYPMKSSSREHMNNHIHERIRRLRENKTPHTVSGNTIAYTAPNGDLVRLEYVEDE